MTLRVSYDQEFDILDLDTGERCSDGASLLAPALSGIAVLIKTDGGHDVAQKLRDKFCEYHAYSSIKQIAFYFDTSYQTCFIVFHRLAVTQFTS